MQWARRDLLHPVGGGPVALSCKDRVRLAIRWAARNNASQVLRWSAPNRI
jgi:hypothetical protein